jgi:4-amino-4-deoxy-L-arabinose transferase-like glycosyltransferase
VGLAFLSAGESKLVTYALPLFPALALLAGEYLSRHLRDGGLEGKGARLAFSIHAVALAVIPQIGLMVVRQRFGPVPPGLSVLVAVFSVLTIAAGLVALRSRSDRRFIAGLAGMSICAVAGMMLVAPRAAEWMTSRDLAAALNRGGALPPRVSVLDERIGSLVFYLDPALRADATRERLEDVSFAEALARARVDPDDAVLAVRAGQLPRFNRLFATPPIPDERAGTFAIFRASTLRSALRYP